MRTTMVLLLLGGSVIAGGSKPADPPLLTSLKSANKNKDAGRLATLLASMRVQEMPADARDALARELVRSLSAFRRNMDVERAVIKALGESGSRHARAPLKKLAFRRKAKGDREISLQVAALLAIGKWRDPKLLGAFEKVVANRNVDIASAAYRALGDFKDANARVRKRVTEVLVKRLHLEYPAYSNANGKWIGDERRNHTHGRSRT